MPRWNTPQPIAVNVELGVGDLHIIASDRKDTVVEVSPSDAAKPRDVEAAGSLRVDFANDTLSISTPRRRTRSLFGVRSASVDVTVEVPSGSVLHINALLAGISCTGTFGDCHVKAGAGDIVFGDARVLTAKTGAGNVTVHRSTGRADISSGTGQIRIDELTGDAVVRNSNGDIWVGSAGDAVARDIQLRTAAGRITIDQTSAHIAAKSAAGGISINGVSAGTVSAHTSYGPVEIGIGAGVAAWLDVSTSYGNVVNELEGADGPAPDDVSVEARARTSFGDITIRRTVVNPSARKKEVHA